MTEYPKKHTRKEFVEFLKENSISDTLIDRFNKLADSISIDNSELYLINIITVGDNHFEINYSSSDYLEFILPYTVHDNFEDCINNVETELGKLKVDRV